MANHTIAPTSSTNFTATDSQVTQLFSLASFRAFMRRFSRGQRRRTFARWTRRALGGNELRFQPPHGPSRDRDIGAHPHIPAVSETPADGRVSVSAQTPRECQEHVHLINTNHRPDNRNGDRQSQDRM